MQLVVPLTALLGLLAFAGLTKIINPSTGSEAVAALLPRRLRPTAARTVLRVVGAGELAVAGVGLASSTRVAGVLVAVAYAALTLIALRIRAVAPTASCGCAGGDAPVSTAHVVINGLGALMGVAGAALTRARIPQLLTHTHGATAAVLAVVLAFLLAGAMNVAGLRVQTPTVKQFGPA